MFSSSMLLWGQKNGSILRLKQNTAARGSAIAMYNVMSSNERYLQNLLMAYNRALLSGTLFWFYNNMMLNPPVGLGSDSLQWTNNSAPYGEKYATQAVSLLVPEEYIVNVYNEALDPPILVTMLDYYGNIISSANDTYIFASTEGYECNSLPGVIDGSTVIGTVQGVANFNKLRARCSPKGNLTIKFISDVPDSSDFFLNIPMNYSILQFRECVDGEILMDKSACTKCPLGSYSLHYDPYNPECSPCPPEAARCEGNIIDLFPGYWRRSEFASTIFPCTYEENACRGGPGVGNELCKIGYEGPLCAVCSSGYYLTDTLECIACSGSKIFTPTVVILLVTLFLALFISVSAYYFKHKKTIDKDETYVPDEKRDSITEEKTFFSRLKSRIVPLLPKLKIMVATFQIVGSVASNFQISMPEEFTKFISLFDILNISADLIPFSCVYPSDFVASLMLNTLVPIAISAILFFSFICELLFRRSKLLANRTNRTNFKLYHLSRNLKFRYASLFYALTYFVLPSVTNKIFQMFVCKNLDPESVDKESDDLYLVADYSISCKSNRFYFGVVWAVVFIFVYPIGIPLFYYYSLYRKRDEIMRREDNQGKVIPVSVSMLQFLYSSYKPKFWYFELVETGRRLTLTAIISVIAAGSSSQIVCAMMLSFFFLKLYGYLTPYEDTQTGFLAEMAQYQVYFTFFGALVTSQSLLGESLNSFMGVMLILVNLMVALTTAYLEYVGDASPKTLESVKSIIPNKTSEQMNFQDGSKEGLEMKELNASKVLTNDLHPGSYCNVSDENSSGGSLCNKESKIVENPMLPPTRFNIKIDNYIDSDDEYE